MWVYLLFDNFIELASIEKLKELSFNDNNNKISDTTTVREALKKMIATEKEITGKLKKLNKVAEDGYENVQGNYGKQCKWVAF